MTDGESLWFILIAIGVVCGLIGSSIGAKKGMSSSGFWFGLLLGPLGLLIIAALTPLRRLKTFSKLPEADDSAPSVRSA